MAEHAKPPLAARTNTSTAVISSHSVRTTTTGSYSTSHSRRRLSDGNSKRTKPEDSDSHLPAGVRPVMSASADVDSDTAAEASENAWGIYDLPATHDLGGSPPRTARTAGTATSPTPTSSGVVSPLHGQLYDAVPSGGAGSMPRASISHEADAGAFGKITRVVVAVRVRPLSEHEKRIGAASVVGTHRGKITLIDPVSMEVNAMVTNHSSGHDMPRRVFSFDHVYGNAGQDQVFNDLGLRVVGHAFGGYNSSIFAYGQTGR
jgi:hypothetical protein